MGFDVFEIMFFVFMAVGIARVILEIFTGDPDEVITFENKDSWNIINPGGNPYYIGDGSLGDELKLNGPMDSVGYGGCAGLLGNACTALYEEDRQMP